MPEKMSADFRYEEAAWADGAERVCGVDEAGRGPLAGPVVVAAVILDPERVPAGIADSKQISERVRERLLDEILDSALASAIVAAPPRVIAERNILGATIWAMREAVLHLMPRADFVLVDGNKIPPGLPVPARAVVSGDAQSLSIAAASILAKVTRDRMCAVMAVEEPQFGFARHKGYGVAAHLAALDKEGPGRHHRLDFAPCAAAALKVGAKSPAATAAAAPAATGSATTARKS